MIWVDSRLWKKVTAGCLAEIILFPVLTKWIFCRWISSFCCPSAHTAPTFATPSDKGITLDCHALKCPQSTGRNLGKSGQASRFSVCTAQCTPNAVLQQTSPAMSSHSFTYHSCLLASRRGGEKQAGSFSSQPGNPLLLSGKPTSITWAVSFLSFFPLSSCQIQYSLSPRWRSFI